MTDTQPIRTRYEEPAPGVARVLFTGRMISAEEAFRHGMVQRIFPRERLEEETLALATRIASRPAIALAMAKRSVNHALDAMGLRTTLDAAFAMHHLNHNHWHRLNGSLVDPEGIVTVRELAKESPMPGLDPRPR